MHANRPAQSRKFLIETSFPGLTIQTNLDNLSQACSEVRHLGDSTAVIPTFPNVVSI